MLPLIERIDAVVFDLFNTLVHFPKRPRHAEVLAEILGVDPVDLAQAMSGVFEDFETGMDPFERMETLMELVGGSTSLAPDELIDVELDELRRSVKPYPGVHNQLCDLDVFGLPMAVCSNANYYGIEIAKYFGILEMMREPYAFSCNVGVRKPNRLIYERAAESVDTPVSRCLYVDDGGDRSLWGAKQIGMITVRVMHVDHEPDDYLEADYQIPGIGDLVDLVLTAD